MQLACEPAMISWRRRGVEQNLPRLYRNTGSLLYACRSIIQNKRPNYARLTGDFSPEGVGRCVWVVCACVCARWTRSEKSRAVSSVLERAVSVGVQYESYMICQCSWRCSKKKVDDDVEWSRTCQGFTGTPGPCFMHVGVLFKINDVFKRASALFKRNNSPAAASRVKGARLTIACASISRQKCEPPLRPCLRILTKSWCVID
jgi:hypothetical protein